MTTFLAAYDTEHRKCIDDALPGILEMHRRHGVPATFFVVARLVDECGADLVRLLRDEPLAEIACHTYTHKLLRDHRLCGKAIPEEGFPKEIVESKKRIEDVFGREVAGFRPAVGFSEGFRGAANILSLCRQAGYKYVSSLLWGPHDSLPGVPREAFAYEEDGYGDLWEIPPCGWHENLLKGHNRWDPRPIQLYPHPMPEVNISGHLASPEEEVALNNKFIDRAVRDSIGHVSLVWHPWSLYRFDPELRMLDGVFRHVRENSLAVDTFAGYAQKLDQSRR